MYVVVFNALGDVVTINTYDVSGGSPTTFSPAIAVTTFVMTKLLVDIDGKAIIVGYDTTGLDQIVVARTNTAVSALDTTFNPDGPIQGCLKYAVGTGVIQVATDALIHQDGRIVITGSEN